MTAETNTVETYMSQAPAGEIWPLSQGDKKRFGYHRRSHERTDRYHWKVAAKKILIPYLTVKHKLQLFCLLKKPAIPW